jgi:hypothetical protein
MATDVWHLLTAFMLVRVVPIHIALRHPCVACPHNGTQFIPTCWCNTVVGCCGSIIGSVAFHIAGLAFNYEAWEGKTGSISHREYGFQLL